MIATATGGQSVDDRPVVGSDPCLPSTFTHLTSTALRDDLTSWAIDAGGRNSYEIRGSEIRPDSDGKVALSLLLRMTNRRDHPDSFWDDVLRLVVGDDTYAPSSWLDELVAGGATGRGTVLFPVRRRLAVSNC